MAVFVYQNQTPKPMRMRRKSMDRLDWEILKALAENPAGSYTEIKEKLNVSIGTIYMRVRRLQEDWGVVKGQKLILDPQKLGFSLVALIRLQTSDPAKFIESLKAHPEVGAAWMTTGEMNILVEAYFRNPSELQDFLSRLVKAGASRMETQLILEKPIDKGTPILPPTNLPERATIRSSRKASSSASAKGKSKK
jgi:Lrp/AsnC family transcriptional regulator, regulator for asnA, asnC and gidA